MLKKNIEHFKSISIKSICLVLIILAMIYLGIWLVISKQLEDKIINTIDTMRDNHINITIDNYKNTGFPGSFATIINRIAYRNYNHSFAWKTKEITVYPPLLSSNTVVINAPSDHFFFIRSDVNQSINKIGLRSDNCNVTLSFKSDIIEEIQLKSNNGIVQTSASTQTYRYDFFGFDMKMSEIILENKLDDIIEMNLDIQNISPSKFWQAVLEDNFSSLTSHIYLRNPSYISELPDFQRYVMRDYDQPEIIIDKMVLIHPLSTLTLSGLLTLDTDMALNGNLTLTISDYQKLLNFLTKKGVLSEEVATNFRFMLSFLLSKKTLQKTDGSVDVGLRIKKNAVYQGKTRLFELAF